MLPEAEPSIAASVRPYRSTEITPERNVRQRTEGSESEHAAGTTGTAPTPLGGWQASESYGPSQTTNDRQNPYSFPHVLASQYLVNGDILALHDRQQTCWVAKLGGKS